MEMLDADSVRDICRIVEATRQTIRTLEGQRLSFKEMAQLAKLKIALSGFQEAYGVK